MGKISHHFDGTLLNKKRKLYSSTDRQRPFTATYTKTMASKNSELRHTNSFTTNQPNDKVITKRQIHPPKFLDKFVHSVCDRACLNRKNLFVQQFFTKLDVFVSTKYCY